MTVWAYYRVSTDKQDYNSQKLGVLDYCDKNGLTIEKEVVDDGVSGCIKAKDRNLNKIIKNGNKGDWLIVSELSRLGRSTIDVLETCRIFGKKGINVYLVKQSIKLDESPMGKMILAILSAFAEMERDLMIQRSKEGIERARQQGKHLGRPFGFTYRKLNIQDVKTLRDTGLAKAEMARLLNCNWNTLHRFMKENKID
jgi:DNA invertase Pin-like site-specific DNA recombinase